MESQPSKLLDQECHPILGAQSCVGGVSKQQTVGTYGASFQGMACIDSGDGTIPECDVRHSRFPWPSTSNDSPRAFEKVGKEQCHRPLGQNTEPLHVLLWKPNA